MGATAEIASDYTKKKNVFRLKLENAAEYLFQAAEEEEMTQWVNAINQVASQEARGHLPARNSQRPHSAIVGY